MPRPSELGGRGGGGRRERRRRRARRRRTAPTIGAAANGGGDAAAATGTAKLPRVRRWARGAPHSAGMRFRVKEARLARAVTLYGKALQARRCRRGLRPARLLGGLAGFRCSAAPTAPPATFSATTALRRRCRCRAHRPRRFLGRRRRQRRVAHAHPGAARASWVCVCAQLQRFEDAQGDYGKALEIDPHSEQLQKDYAAIGAQLKGGAK